MSEPSKMPRPPALTPDQTRAIGESLARAVQGAQAAAAALRVTLVPTPVGDPVLVDEYTGWTADPDDPTFRQYEYESPWKPGDRIRARRGDTVIEGRVARTDGYAPGVVELEGMKRGIDLVGWMVETL